jgi:hypothetical protein
VRDWIATVPIVLLVPVLLVPFVAASAGGPTLTVEPAVAAAGQTVRVSGSGFPPKSSGSITIDGVAVALSSYSTNPQGAFRAKVSLPSDLASGEHRVEARPTLDADPLAVSTIRVDDGVTRGGPPAPADPTPAPEPTATPTPAPTPTAAVTPSPTATPTASPMATSTASPTATPTASPTATPTASPTSLSGETCPSSVHDKYVAQGPDGLLYRTWHPQRDPETGCYFNHEHGSNPALFAAAGTYRPTFGYVGGIAGFAEPHVGYKNFLMDDGNGHHWLFTVHIGTSGPARVCTRFHSVDLAIARISTGELLARVHFMGDFGRAEDNKSLQALTPDACPDQYLKAVNDDSKGMRQLSVDTVGEGQYEPWRVDERRLILGLTGSRLVFNTLSALTTCNGMACNTVSLTGHTGAGAFRMLDYQTGLAFVAGTNTGTFTTEPYGRTLGGSVRQYVKAGINVAAQPNGADEHYWPTDPVDMLYRCSIGGSPITARSTNIDGQIKVPN